MNRSQDHKRELRDAWVIGLAFTALLVALLGSVAALGTHFDSLHDQAIADVNAIEDHIHAQATTIAVQALTITLQAETISDAEIRDLDHYDKDRDGMPNFMDPDTDADGRCNEVGTSDSANPGLDPVACSGEADLDDDGDGSPDVVDPYPVDPTYP